MKKYVWLQLICLFICVSSLVYGQKSDKKVIKQWQKINSQALKEYSQGKYRKALVLAQKAYNISYTKLGHQHPKTLISMNNLARTYKDQGKYEQALPLLEQVLEISKKMLGNQHPNTLSSMNNLAMIYRDLGKYEQALSILEQVVKASKKVLGNQHPNTLSSMNNLATIYRDLGKYEEALSIFEQALKASKKVLGNQHPNTLPYMNNLASTYKDQGKYEQALPLLEQVLEISKKVLGNQHPNTLSSMNNLAMVYRDLGKYEQALSIFEQTVKTRKKVLGYQHPNTLNSMNNLVMVYQDLGKYEQALPIFEQVVKASKKVLGYQHPNTLSSMNNLAMVYQDLDKYKQALPILEHVLKISKKVLGHQHPSTLSSMSNLARIYKYLGKYKQALSIFEQVLKIRKKILGDQHPHTLGSKNHLAYLNYSIENYEKSWSMGLSCFSMRINLLKKNLSFLNTQEKLQRISHYISPFHNLSLNLSIQQKKKSWVEQSFAITLYRKSLATQLLSQERKLLIHADDKLLALHKEYQNMNRRLNHISYFNIPKNIKEKLAQKNKLQKLTWLKQKLEEKISQLSANSPYLHFPNWSIEDVREIQKKLPGDSALLEFVSFLHFKQKENWIGVFVVRSQSVQFVPLAATKQIKIAVKKILEQISQDGQNFPLVLAKNGTKAAQKFLQNQEQILAQDSSELRKLLLPPAIEKSLVGTSLLLLAPDDVLHFLSFAMLAQKKQGKIRYLVEDYDLVYLSSGKSLLEKYSKQGKGFYGMGNPNYDLLSQAKMTIKLPQPPQQFAAFATRGKLSNYKWQPLPSGSKEIHVVKEWYSLRYDQDKMTVREKKQALEANLILEAPGKRWLHIATHGFFLDEKKVDVGLQQMMSNKIISQKAKISNPLSLSGLVLSGANSHQQSSKANNLDDGYLTAGDISLLDLKGVKCVVLSCCETGLGQYLSGIGVFSFKWAFEYAGARYLMVSLWKVPDQETLVLMNDFYGNHSSLEVWKAFLKSQLKYFKRHQRLQTGKSHPYFWAAFICQGNPLTVDISTQFATSYAKQSPKLKIYRYIVIIGILLVLLIVIIRNWKTIKQQ